MDLRYYIDPETGQPHIYRHGVAEPSIDTVWRSMRLTRFSDGPWRIARGERDPGSHWGEPKEAGFCASSTCLILAPESAFVITAYQLGPKALRALRRRRRRRS